MILYYTRQCSPSIYSEQTDEEFYDEKEIEYEPSDAELEDALIDIIYNIYFKDSSVEKSQIIGCIRDFITDIDFDYEMFRDELTDYFENEVE